MQTALVFTTTVCLLVLLLIDMPLNPQTGTLLMRAVFAPEELMGRTLYGRPCNAHKNMDVNPAVDDTRREVVLGMYGVLGYVVH